MELTCGMCSIIAASRGVRFVARMKGRAYSYFAFICPCGHENRLTWQAYKAAKKNKGVCATPIQAAPEPTPVTPTPEPALATTDVVERPKIITLPGPIIAPRFMRPTNGLVASAFLSRYGRPRVLVFQPEFAYPARINCDERMLDWVLSH